MSHVRAFDTNAPIAIGDLVVVVRWCCTHPRAPVGSIFKVADLCDGSLTSCKLCNAWHPEGGHALGPGASPNRMGAPVAWLKRIPPLEELEGTRTDQPIEEPA